MVKAKDKKRKVLRDINIESDESMISDYSDEDIAVQGRNSVEKAALSKRFQKKDMVEHILLRADVYIGSPHMTEDKVWVFDNKKKEMVYKTINYSPGLYKIFDEILVNAADNKQRDPSMRSIKVTIDKDLGEISVQNDGKGIPVEMHQEHNVYIPELIFGHLLTGENFEDTKKRIVGGKNGYGAKLTNIFSTSFEIETVDSKGGLKYYQKWTDNMGVKSKPKITKCSSKTKDYTKVTFRPDFKRFQSEELENDTYDLFCKRVYDIAGITHLSLKVHLNGTKLKVDRFKNYVDLYINAINKGSKTSSGSDESESMSVSSDINSEKEEDEMKFMKVYEKINDYWEVCITQSPGSFGHLSFVNSICTYKGGKHVDYITDLVVKQLASKLSSDKDMKKEKINNSTIKNNVFVFVNSLIVNPTFNSQSKEYLATPPSKFGDKKNLPTLASKTIKNLCTSEIIERIKASVAAQNIRKMNRKTKGKRSGPLNIDKLEDAKNAGTKKWKNCTLLLTEGDSAKTTAISGLSVIGRDNYGVFPLKGKLLNVRDATNAQIGKNKEIENICKIVGLAVGDKVDPALFDRSCKKKGLRYGHIMIMTDQDHDGSHIKGLLFNFIHHYWPELLKKVPNFVQVFITPILKCFPKTGKKEILTFYTIPEYERWREENEDIVSKYRIKYYKGLGTSSKQEAKSYFKDLKKHKIQMKWDDDQNTSGKAIELAFSKKRVAERKVWLTDYNENYGNGNSPDGYVDFSKKKMTYSTFVNKELVHFSLADNIRSIPSVVDGLKPSQRKVLFGCIKKFLNKRTYSKETLKVASLAGYISGVTAYHHGEMSLQGTMVSMAQDFVASNNINLLTPAGQFGSRLAGGKDASQARYISTGATKLLTKIFRKEDEGILNFLQEEGMSIEPEYYFPIIPTVLVNGAQGIGTGWSTDIAMHNPTDIVNWLKRRMNIDEEEEVGSIVALHPWYRGYTGVIIKAKDTKYISRGSYSLEEDDYKDEYRLRITELPINKWTNAYKKFLSDMLETELSKDEPAIKGIINDSSDDAVDFTVLLSKKFYDALENDEKLVLKTFGLEKPVSGTTNMHLFDYKHRIRKYNSQHDILEEFYRLRKQKYIERKAHIISVLETNLQKLSNEQRFVFEVATGKISITRRKKVDLEKELEKKGFDKLAPSNQKQQANDDEEEYEANKSFAYLLRIPILSLTLEKVENLKQKVDDLTQELNAYQKLEILDIWRSELEEFTTEYKNYLKETGCDKLEQETVIPEEFKRKKDAVGRKSMLTEREVAAISDITQSLENKCEVTPKKPSRKNKMEDQLQGSLEKKQKIEKFKKTKKKTNVLIDSDLSDISLSEDDEEEEAAMGIESEEEEKVIKKSVVSKKSKKDSPEISSDLSNFTVNEEEMVVESPKPVKRTKTKKSKSKSVYTFSSEDEEPIKKKITKKKISVLDSESEVEEPKKKKGKAKKKAAEPIQVDSDESQSEDLSDVETPKPKRPTRSRRAVKKPVFVASDLSSAGEEESEASFSEEEDSEYESD